MTSPFMCPLPLPCAVADAPQVTPAAPTAAPRGRPMRETPQVRTVMNQQLDILVAAACVSAWSRRSRGMPSAGPAANEQARTRDSAKRTAGAYTGGRWDRQHSSSIRVAASTGDTCNAGVTRHAQSEHSESGAGSRNDTQRRVPARSPPRVLQWRFNRCCTPYPCTTAARPGLTTRPWSQRLSIAAVHPRSGALGVPPAGPVPAPTSRLQYLPPT